MSSVRGMPIDAICELAKVHDMQTAKQIARRLKATREALGLNQAELCRRAGIERNAWNMFEKGTRQITVTNAVRLYEAFGVTLDWVYLGLRRGLDGELQEKLAKVA